MMFKHCRIQIIAPNPRPTLQRQTQEEGVHVEIPKRTPAMNPTLMAALFLAIKYSCKEI